VINTLLDAGFPAGSLNYWLSSFTRGLPDELIDIAVERFAAVPSPMTGILLEHFHGALTRVGATEATVPHRHEGWNLLIPFVSTDPADSDANISWSRETFAALRPHFATGRWLNYLGDDQAEDAIRSAYGPNYARLREVSGGTTRRTSSTSTTTSRRSAAAGPIRSVNGPGPCLP
jgi:hypothetical protein